jgi:hypothetical protein
MILLVGFRFVKLHVWTGVKQENQMDERGDSVS